MATVRELVTRWGFKVDDRPLRRVERRVVALKKDLRGLARLTRNVGLAYGALGLGIGFLLRHAGNFEQIEIAFEVLTQSATKSKKLIADLQAFAIKTPFQLTGLFENTKLLLAMGFQAEEMIDTLTALGNIAAGVGRDKLPRLALALGQVRAAGRLRGQEVRQFTEAGVPIEAAIAKRMGVARNEIMDLISQRKVSFEVVNAAIQDLANGTGRFTGLMDKQSKTLLGVFSNIKDAIEITAIAVGGTLLPEAKQLANQFLNFVMANKEMIKLKTSRFIGAVVRGLKQMARIGRAVLRVLQAVTNAFGGLENALRLVTFALAALVAVRAVNFLGNLGLVALSAAKNLGVFIFRARSAGVALLGLKAIALAIPILLGAAFVGLFLIIEDIVAFFQGRDSLVGGLVTDFDKNAPAFIGALDKFESVVLGKVKRFMKKFEEFFTSDEFAPQRQRLADALLTALDVAIVSSAALARIGFSIGQAIFDGIAEVFAERSPRLARLLGLVSSKQRAKTFKSSQRTSEKRFLAEQLFKGTTAGELASGGFDPKAIADAQKRVAIRRQLQTKKGELFLHKNPELKSALEDAVISTQELLTGNIAAQLRQLGQVTGVQTKGLILGRKVPNGAGIGANTINQSNVVNINGSGLPPEELKKAVGDGITDANEKLLRATERTVRSAVTE